MASYAPATSIGRLLGSDLHESLGGRARASSTSSSSSSSTATVRTSNARRCGFPECLKTAKPGGLCISHGGGKKCSVEGCTTSVVSRGFCVAHGGGKRCQRDGCTKSAQTGGFCWIHGGGKKCGHDGCTKRAQSGGACISHGGGKRCRMDGCNKVVQYEGLCVGHGGYRKCLSMNCSKKALPNGYCHGHGGNAQCHFQDCSKKAVHGGFCGPHRRFGSPHQIALSRSSSTSDSPVVVDHSIRSLRDVATISPLMPLPFAVQQTGRDWSQAIAEAKTSSVVRGGSDRSMQDAELNSSRGQTMWPRRLPTVVELQRSCSLDRSVSPLKTRLGFERIQPLLSAIESAQAQDTIVEIKQEPVDESPREPHAQQCGVRSCGRFAKVHGVCLLHYHLQYERQSCTRRMPAIDSSPYAPIVRSIEFMH